MSKPIEHFSAKALFDAQKQVKNACYPPLSLNDAADVSFQEPKIPEIFLGLLNFKSFVQDTAL